MSSLAKCLARSVKRYPSQERTAWLMTGSEAQRDDPSQIALLCASIFYVRETEKAQDDIVAGNANAMKDHVVNIKKQVSERSERA